MPVHPAAWVGVGSGCRCRSDDDHAPGRAGDLRAQRSSRSSPSWPTRRRGSVFAPISGSRADRRGPAGLRVPAASGRGTGVLTLPRSRSVPVVLFGTVDPRGVARWPDRRPPARRRDPGGRAAHTLADALGLLRHAPSALAGITTALVVAVSVLPTLGRSVLDVRQAARLRGKQPGLRRTVVPSWRGPWTGRPRWPQP